MISNLTQIDLSKITPDKIKTKNKKVRGLKFWSEKSCIVAPIPTPNTHTQRHTHARYLVFNQSVILWLRNIRKTLFALWNHQVIVWSNTLSVLKAYEIARELMSRTEIRKCHRRKTFLSSFLRQKVNGKTHLVKNVFKTGSN